MIQTVGLTKAFGKVVAVDGLNLNIPSGQIYGFLGPNGAGKTTTIMMLLGAIKPTTGQIFLFGEAYTSARLDLRRRIGVVPEKHPVGAWSWMSCQEYLAMFAELFRVKDADRRIDHLMDRAGLAEAKQKRLGELSHGMTQKLSIIRALLPNPDILFLDEPISGLDPFGVKQTRDLIMEENREGRTIFISSHILSEMEKICHRVAIIYKGRLLVEDQMQGLLAAFTRKREIHIALEAVPPDLPALMKALDFVLEVSTQGNKVIVGVPKTGDYRKELSRFLFSRNLVPLAIQENSASLEEAFFTITQETIDLFVRTGNRV